MWILSKRPENQRSRHIAPNLVRGIARPRVIACTCAIPLSGAEVDSFDHEPTRAYSWPWRHAAERGGATAGCAFRTVRSGLVMATRREISAGLPIVFGLSELEAAAAIGISATKFRELRKAKRMPAPRRIDSRLVYDVDELRAAFKAMPHDAEETEGADTWADI
jgi:hypothetical protein